VVAQGVHAVLAVIGEPGSLPGRPPYFVVERRPVKCEPADGGEDECLRPRLAARFPARKSLEEFDYDHARALKRDTIAHLGTLDFVTARDNAVFLGPPGTGKTHLAIGLAIRACQAGHRVLFATAAQWVARLADAHTAGRLQAELVRLGRYPLLVIDLCRRRNYADAGGICLRSGLIRAGSLALGRSGRSA
jgi:hypothetical protein